MYVYKIFIYIIMTNYDPWNNNNINILNISLNRNTTFFILGPINKYNLRYELEIVIKKQLNKFI